MKEKKNNNKKKVISHKQTNNQKKQSNTKQNIIVAFLVVIIIVCVFLSIKTIIKSPKAEDNEINNSDAIHKEVLNDAKVGDLTITDANLTVNNDVTSFMATAKNETENDYYINTLYITFTNGKATHKIPILSDITIKANESKLITLTLDIDISDTTKIDYELK